MSNLYRVRVAAVGGEEAMSSLLRVMLRNIEALDEPDDRPPFSLKELHAALLQHAAWELGEGETFDYATVAPHPFGEAEPEARFELLTLPGGLLAASFAYESADRFQPEDWLSLHRASGRVPMFAIYAGDTFDMDKGGMVFSAGQAMEDWNRMAEVWFWLRKGFEIGRTPEEIPDKLAKIADTLEREMWDQSVGELLTSCAALLDYAEAGRNVTPAMIREAAEARDFGRVFALTAQAADSVLFDAQHAALYRACLKQDIDRWRQVHPEEVPE